MQAPTLEALLARITRWAQAEPDIYALALVGSQARGTARPDSDIDLIVLGPRPNVFRQDKSWPAGLFPEVGLWWTDVDYGGIWSRHLYLDSGPEIEFGFGLSDWAKIDPLDPGTAEVMAGGCRVLYDPHQLLAKLLNFLA